MEVFDVISHLESSVRAAKTYFEAGNVTGAVEQLAGTRAFLNDQPELEAGGAPATPESPAPPEQETEQPDSDPG